MNLTAPPARTTIISRAEYDRRLELWGASQNPWIWWVVLAIGALSVWGGPMAVAAGLLPRRALLIAFIVGVLATFGLPLLIIAQANRRKAKLGLVCPECATSLVGTQTQDAVTPAGDCLRCGAAVMEPTGEVRELEARVAAAGTTLPSRAELEPRLGQAAAASSTRLGLSIGGMTLLMLLPSALIALPGSRLVKTAVPLVLLVALVAALRAAKGSAQRRERGLGVFCPGCDKPLLRGPLHTVLRTGRCTQCGHPVMRRRPGERAEDDVMPPDRAERHILWLLLLMMGTLLARGFAPRGEEASMLRSGSMVLIPVAILLAWAGARLLAPRWWKEATVIGRMGVISFPALMLAFTLLLSAPLINALLPPQTREVVQGRVIRTYLTKGETVRPIAVIQVAGRAEPLELRVARREFDAMKPGDPFRREMVRGGLGLYYFPR